jgi:hypothetical protein
MASMNSFAGSASSTTNGNSDRTWFCGRGSRESQCTISSPDR